MAIQLVIRHNLEEHEATFVPGELRTFDAREVCIGSGKACACMLPAVGIDVLPAEVAMLRQDGKTWVVSPVPGVPLFLNQNPVSAPCEIRSGDELRCGHWIFRFHKTMRPVTHGKAADLLAASAKILAVLILVAEISIVYLLPKQVRSAQQWELQICRQRTSILVDELRKANTLAKVRSPGEQAARKYLSSQLDVVAMYIRKNQEQLNRAQWRAVADDLEIYRSALAITNQGGLFGELPPPAVEAGVRAVTGK